MAGPRQQAHEFGDCHDKNGFRKRLWDYGARRPPSITTFHTRGEVLQRMHESWPQATSGAASSASPPAYVADTALNTHHDYCDLVHLSPGEMLGIQPPIPLSELVATRMNECADSDAVLRQFADCAAACTTLASTATSAAIQTGLSEGMQRRGDEVRKRFDGVLAQLKVDDGAAHGPPETGRARPVDANENFKDFYKAPAVYTTQVCGKPVLNVSKMINRVMIQTTIGQERAAWLRAKGEDPLAWIQAQWRICALESSDSSVAELAWDAHEELKDAASLLRMADASADVDAALAAAAAEMPVGDEFESDSPLTSDDEGSDYEGTE